MSLQIVSGRSGTGKSTFIHKEMIENLKSDVLGYPIYLIVPDQMSFTAEYELTNTYNIDGMMRAQVLSFKRFAWQVLQRTGGVAKEKMDGFGYRMMIRQVLEEHKEELELFRQSASKHGFTQEVEMLLREFGQYDVTSETIGPLIAELEKVSATNTLLAKLKDMQVIVSAMEEKLGDRYVDGESFYPILVEQLMNVEDIAETEFYLDGFVRFSKREFDIVLRLMQLAKKVTITLPFYAPEHAAPENDDELFHQGALTYSKLMDAAIEYGIEVEPRIHLEENYRFKCGDLKHIEENFEMITPVRKQSERGGVHVIEGANRRAEVQFISREILRLVREEDVRYRDIGIMYRQPDVYDDMIKTAFMQYHIPYFSNEKRPMLHHPLIELVRSVLEAIDGDWQYEPIFRGVKTDLFFPLGARMQPLREQMDQFENFVLAKGIFSKSRWQDEKTWQYRRFRTLENTDIVQTDAEKEKERELHRMRDIIREPLQALEKQLKAANNAREMATALYEFVERMQVYEKLEKLYAEEFEEAAFTFASEHEQVWNAWVNVLEQFVILFGDDEMSLEEMRKLLDEGYGMLQFSGVPPTFDEVTVSTLDFARFDNKKVIFIIGVNDGVYPMRIDKEGLISDAERELIGQTDFEVAPNSKSKLLQEAFLMYRGMASPKERLYITFASADEEGKGLLPSTYVQRLHKMFEVDGERTLPHTRVEIDPLDELKEENVRHYLQHPHPTLAYLTVQEKIALQTKVLPADWSAVRQYYEMEPKWTSILHTVLKPLNRRNVAEQLPEETTVALYGEELHSSISQVEKFYRCPFSHFVSYGLRLQDRPEFKLESFAMGDLFHEALRTIFTERKDQMPSTFSECLAIARETVNPLVDIFSYRILESSARYVYIKEKLIRIVARTLFALTEQSKATKFKAVVHEKPFGMQDAKSTDKKEESLPPYEIELSNKRKMYLRGQIDRIDTLQTENELLLRVIDYKSSSRDLDLVEVYHGLSLQLLTYLEVAMRNAKLLVPSAPEHIIPVPAGMLYVHVHDPLLKLEEIVDEQVRELQRLEKYKMGGLVTNDLDILTLMDEKLPEDKESKIIPVKLTKTGLSASSKAVEQEAIPALQQFVMNKHRQAGDAIYTGTTAIEPFSLKTKTACDYCEYKSICQFDPTDGQSYKDLKAIPKKEVVSTILRECGYHDSNETE